MPLSSTSLKLGSRPRACCPFNILTTFNGQRTTKRNGFGGWALPQTFSRDGSHAAVFRGTTNTRGGLTLLPSCAVLRPGCEAIFTGRIRFPPRFRTGSRHRRDFSNSDLVSSTVNRYRSAPQGVGNRASLATSKEPIAFSRTKNVAILDAVLCSNTKSVYKAAQQPPQENESACCQHAKRRSSYLVRRRRLSSPRHPRDEQRVPQPAWSIATPIPEKADHRQRNAGNTLGQRYTP